MARNAADKVRRVLVFARWLAANNGSLITDFLFVPAHVRAEEAISRVDRGVSLTTKNTKNARVGTPPPLPVFRAKHPFVFLIQDKHTGSILFMGRLMDPVGESTVMAVLNALSITLQDFTAQTV